MAKLVSVGLFLSSVFCANGAVASIKIGGITKGDGSYGKQARDVFAQLADKITGTTVTYTWIDITADDNAEGSTMPSADWFAEKTRLLTTGNNSVDFFIPPYGSTQTKRCVSAINNSKVTILVWGGASDSIFEGDDAPCKNKKCLGFFTKGSEYLRAGLLGINEILGEQTKIGLIHNDNAFSNSVANGVVKLATDSEDSSKFEIVKKVEIAKGAVMNEADDGRVAEVLALKPNVIAIAGHAEGDVENIVIKVRQGEWRPDAIISTNALTGKATTFFASKAEADAQSCLMMPTQWAGDATMVDDVAGLAWTKAKFETIVSGATYHAASAGAAAITVAKLMEAVNAADAPAITDMAQIEGVAGLKALFTLPFNTFYGPINWNDDGSISGKPMYVQQKHGESSMPIVFPVADKAADAKIPLTECEAWDTAVADTSERVLPAALIALTVVIAYFANI